MTDARDTNGRFAAGNPGGRGGRKRSRTSELRQAALDAVTPEHIAMLMRQVLKLGLQGNLPAAKFVLEHTTGKAADNPVDPEPVDLQLPPLLTAADCNLATTEVLNAMVAGRIDRAIVQVLLGAVQTKLRALETSELEQRLLQLEAKAKDVQMPERPFDPDDFQFE